MRLLVLVMMLGTMGWAGDLPDAPSATGKQEKPVVPAHAGSLAPADVGDAQYWTMSGALVAATVANVELSSRCIQQRTCMTFSPVERRRSLYAIALPVDAGLMLLSYKLKADEHKWWFVPISLFTAGHSYSAIRSAQHIR